MNFNNIALNQKIMFSNNKLFSLVSKYLCIPTAVVLEDALAIFTNAFGSLQEQESLLVERFHRNGL